MRNISRFLRRLACLATVLWTCILVLGRKLGWLALRVLLRFDDRLVARVRFAFWSRRDKQQFVSGLSSPRIDISSLKLEPHELMKLQARARTEPRVEIGEFDQDGFLLSKVGPIEGIPKVEARNFMPRKRFTLRLVLLGNSVAVEKDFRGDKSSFVREVTALCRLNAAGCHVPAILDLDFKTTCLSISFIKGKVLREELAIAGALLRDCDVAVQPECRALSAEALHSRRIEAGRRLLLNVVTDDFLENLYRTLQRVHRAGVALMDVKFGNILIEATSREPWLIDFDKASSPWLFGKFLFSLLRDYDTEQFNSIFGTKHITFNLLRKHLQNIGVHFPLYIGYGLSLGTPWRAIARQARWRYLIKHHLPPLQGKRVLDLDPSNDFHAFELLRLGASQVVAIHPDANLMKQARFVQDAFEWADNTRYNLEWIQMDTRQALMHDQGRFDVVFAPCDPEGRDPGSLHSLTRHISTITRMVVCRYNASPDVPGPKRDDVRRILQANGFRVLKVIPEAFALQAFIIAEKA